MSTEQDVKTLLDEVAQRLRLAPQQLLQRHPQVRAALQRVLAQQPPRQKG